MRRNLTAIYSILLAVANREERDSEPTVIVPERIPDEELSRSFAYFSNMLVENGFLRKVEAQADFGCRLLPYHLEGTLLHRHV